MNGDLDRSHPLYRKIGAAPERGASGDGAMRRAFRMVLARAGEDFSGIQIVVTGLSSGARDMDQMMGDLADVPVIFVLAGPQEARGIAILDHQMIAALLEHATTGRVVKSAAEARKPTRTDVTICAEFLDRCLTGLAVELSDNAEAPDISGFHYDHTLGDARAVELAFDDMAYKSFEISVDCEGAAKSGMMTLFLPDAQAATGTVHQGNRENWAQAWAEQVQHAPVSLEAVLGHKTMALSDIADLQAGMVVELPQAGLSTVTLLGQNGQIVARGKLGRQGNVKAVRVDRVSDQDSPDAHNASRPVPGFEIGANLTPALAMAAPEVPGGVAAPPMPALSPGQMPNLTPGASGDVSAPLDMAMATPMATPPGADAGRLPNGAQEADSNVATADPEFGAPADGADPGAADITAPPVPVNGLGAVEPVS